MYSYHVNLVWLIDGIFLFLVLFLSAVIIAYAAIKESLTDKRLRSLVAIKTNLHSLAQSGKGEIKDACPVIVDKATPEQFLEIIRDRRSLLPEKIEQQLRECFVAYGKIGDIERIARKSRNKWYKIQALLILGYANSPHGLEILKSSMLSKDEDVSYFSLLALGQIKNRASAKILLDFLGKHIFSGYRIVSLLETFPAEVVEEALRATYDKDPFVRFWAVKLLAKFKPVQGLMRIKELTADGSADVRAASCECLGELGEKEARDTLRSCLNDEVWFVRMHAARALSKVSESGYAPEIASLMEDKSWLVRDSVKKIMTHNIEAYLSHIEKIIQSDNRIAKKDCIEALEESGYFIKLLKNTLSQDLPIKNKALEILKGLIQSGCHVGFESALSGLEEDPRNRILEAMKDIDKVLAEDIDKKIKQQVVEA